MPLIKYRTGIPISKLTEKKTSTDKDSLSKIVSNTISYNKINKIYSQLLTNRKNQQLD